MCILLSCLSFWFFFSLFLSLLPLVSLEALFACTSFLLTFFPRPLSSSLEFSFYWTDRVCKKAIIILLSSSSSWSCLLRDNLTPVVIILIILVSLQDSMQVTSSFSFPFVCPSEERLGSHDEETQFVDDVKDLWPLFSLEEEVEEECIVSSTRIKRNEANKRHQANIKWKTTNTTHGIHSLSSSWTKTRDRGSCMKRIMISVWWRMSSVYDFIERRRALLCGSIILSFRYFFYAACVCFTVICFTRIFMECQELMQNKRTEQEELNECLSIVLFTCHSFIQVVFLFLYFVFESLVVQDKSSAMTRDTIKEITGQWENMSLCLLVFSYSLLHVIAWFAAKQISLLDKEVPSDCFSLPNFLNKKNIHWLACCCDSIEPFSWQSSSPSPERDSLSLHPVVKVMSSPSSSSM